MSNPLADLIQRGESGAKNYDAYNRGTYRDSGGKERIRGADHAIDFSSLTLGQVLDAQALTKGAPDRLFAVGRYQVIPQTLKAAAHALQLERDAPFTDQMQDRIFSEYLITHKRPAIRDYITGERGATLESAQLALAQEWASIASPETGRSYYDKPGGANHASVSSREAANALNEMRMVYQSALAAGDSPGQAWDRFNPTAASSYAPTQAPAKRTVDDVLSPGESGEAVAQMQRQLTELGYAGRNGRPLSADGSFGPETRIAVERFQQDHGLRVDGVAGQQTRDALQGARATIPASGPCPPAVAQAESQSAHDGLQALFEAARSKDPQAMRSALLELTGSPLGQAFAAPRSQHATAPGESQELATERDVGIGR